MSMLFSSCFLGFPHLLIIVLNLCIWKIADMLGLGMGISLLEIQRNGPAYWQTRKFAGVCMLPDFGWQKRGNIVNFLQDLEGATRIVENALTFTTRPRLQFVRSFWRAYVQMLTANWPTRFTFPIFTLKIFDTVLFFAPNSDAFGLSMLFSFAYFLHGYLYLQVIPERMPDCSYYLQGLYAFF